MNLASFLSPNRTLCNVSCSSKKRALEMVASCAAGDLLNTKSETIFTHLFDRERLGSTGFGNGIAIPHCRIEGIDSVVGLLITLANPIPFDAPDDQPVDLIFALLAPTEAAEAHLQTLSTVAERLSNPVYVSELRSANSSSSLYDLAIN